jgi:fermentation-respiration switch protein FrsA (DUF1100 family)
MSAATLVAAAASALAITEPANAVRTERVTFLSGQDTVVGTLFVPANIERGRRVPGVVVTGAWMTIKEQMAGRYARELAERGYITLAFDFRTWGESGGAQRSMESPTVKIEDIGAAARFLGARADVSRVGGLGICASAGYMVQAAINDPVITSVALVAPWLHNAGIVNAVYGGAESVQHLIDLSRTAQSRFGATGALTLLPAAGPQGSNAVMAGAPYYTEADRGAIPQWENTFNVASWEGWLTFDALAPAAMLTQPTLIVHSEAAAIPQGARQFFNALRAPKSQLWLDGVSQFDFYDRETPVDTAADAVAEHFGRTLLVASDEQPVSPAGDPETAKIISVVSSIPLAVDLARYDLAEAAFAPTITVDYTSLWGGAPQRTTPAELMQAWREIVPGFDATRHELRDVQAQVEGSAALATASVDGRHWIGASLWRPIGRYSWELTKRDGRWAVTSMTFTLTQELGDRALAQEAMARAKARARSAR